MSEEKRFHFSGTATVSVICKVDADSEEEAREMIESGDAEWYCAEVDGEVEDIELSSVEE